MKYSTLSGVHCGRVSQLAIKGGGDRRRHKATPESRRGLRCGVDARFCAFLLGFGLYTLLAAEEHEEEQLARSQRDRRDLR
jgi:hypothetical protein